MCIICGYEIAAPLGKEETTEHTEVTDPTEVTDTSILGIPEEQNDSNDTDFSAQLAIVIAIVIVGTIAVFVVIKKK